MTPRILFLSLANDVGCERIVAEMAQCGVECGLVSPADFYCTALCCLAWRSILPRGLGMRFNIPFVRVHLERAMRAWQPQLVLPLDDLSSWLLRSLAVDPGADAGLRETLIHSLGSPQGYAASINRSAFMDRAQALGIDKPDHCAITDRNSALEQARAWGYPVVMKIEQTSGGVGVALVQDASELKSRLDNLLDNGLFRTIKHRFKQMVYERAGLRQNTTLGILQSFVAGRPAFRTVAAHEGRVLCGVSFVAEQTDPVPTGASTVVRHIENQAMEAATSALVAALGCSGFVSFDFMVDPAQQRAWVIEMNPRSIGTTHLGRLFGNDVCGHLAATLGARASRPAPIRPAGDLVALFPKEIERNPASPYLRSPAVYHDIPSDEPRLVELYSRRLRRKKRGGGRNTLDKPWKTADSGPHAREISQKPS
ncbi:ATP-binding protein [Labrys neptuniae]